MRGREGGRSNVREIGSLLYCVNILPLCINLQLKTLAANKMFFFFLD